MHDVVSWNCQSFKGHWLVTKVYSYFRPAQYTKHNKQPLSQEFSETVVRCLKHRRVVIVYLINRRGLMHACVGRDEQSNVLALEVQIWWTVIMVKEHSNC